MDHGLGAVDALLVVPHEPAPPGHPSEGALDDPAAWKDFEAPRGIGPFDDFDGEVEEGKLESRPNLPFNGFSNGL
jgi:hypothetical protein